MRVLVHAFGIFVMLFLIFVVIGSVSIHYPHVIEKEPLNNPVRIASIAGNTLTLVDGRSFDLDPAPYKPWPDIFAESDNIVEIDNTIPDTLAIFANQKGWICGTPWAAPIRIPLIPVTVYRDCREFVTPAEAKPVR